MTNRKIGMSSETEKRDWRIITADVLDGLAQLEGESVNCVVTSPPYWGLRDYGVVGQIGLEPTPEEYVARMVEVFREVRRVLRPDGTLWLNLGDSYAGSWGNYSPHSPLRLPNVVFWLGVRLEA
jgi:DNA modification methylase